MLMALCGCETWSLTLREERRLRVLRRIFGLKTDEVTGEWRRLYNEELHISYSSQNIISLIKSRRIRWVVHVVCMWDRRVAYRVLVGNLRKGTTWKT